MEKMAELLKDDRSGGEQLPAGMSWDKFFSDVGAELKHQVSAGAHELAAALFTGQGFVMYPRQPEAVEQEPHHGIPVEPLQKEIDQGIER